MDLSFYVGSPYPRSWLRAAVAPVGYPGQSLVPVGG